MYQLMSSIKESQRIGGLQKEILSVRPRIHSSKKAAPCSVMLARAALSVSPSFDDESPV